MLRMEGIRTRDVRAEVYPMTGLLGRDVIREPCLAVADVDIFNSSPQASECRRSPGLRMCRKRQRR